MQSEDRRQWILNAFPILCGFLDGLLAALFAGSAWRGGMAGRLLFAGAVGLVIGLFGLVLMRFLLKIFVQVMADSQKAGENKATAKPASKTSKTGKKRGSKGTRR